MPGVDLASLVQDTLATSAGMNAGIAKINANNEAAQQIGQTQVQINNQAADAESEKTRIDLEAKAKTEQETNALALRMGAMPGVAGSFILDAAEKSKQGYAMLDDAASRIHAKESVGFLDNPVEWLVNKATIGKDIADYNYAAGIVNNAEDMAKEQSALFDEGVKQIKATQSTISQAYINASTITAAAKYRNDALQAATQSLHMNSQGIALATSMGTEQLKLLYSANTAVREQQQVDISLQRLRLETASFNLTKAAKDEKVSEDQLAVRLIAQGYANMNGGRTMPPDEMHNALARMKFKDPRMQAYFDSGVETSGLGGKPVISSSPFKASEFIGTKLVTSFASPQMQQVGEQVASWRKEFDNLPVGSKPNIAQGDKTGYQRAFDDWVTEKIKKTPEQYPIFQPMKLSEYTTASPKSANLPVWKNVLAPAAAAGANVDDPNVAFGIITAAMREGKLSYPDAQDYSPLVAGAMQLKQASNNLIAFGLVMPKKYETNLQLTQEPGSDKVNIVDQASWARALNTSESRYIGSKTRLGGVN